MTVTTPSRAKVGAVVERVATRRRTSGCRRGSRPAPAARWPPGSGVHTLRLRQSSPAGGRASRVHQARLDRVVVLDVAVPEAGRVAHPVPRRARPRRPEPQLADRAARRRGCRGRRGRRPPGFRAPRPGASRRSAPRLHGCCAHPCSSSAHPSGNLRPARPGRRSTAAPRSRAGGRARRARRPPRPTTRSRGRRCGTRPAPRGVAAGSRIRGRRRTRPRSRRRRGDCGEGSSACIHELRGCRASRHWGAHP